MKKFFAEFRDFIAKGNVIDLAVGVIIGGAFSNIVKSLVENVITPLISMITKNVSFTEMFYVLDVEKRAEFADATLAEVTEAGVAVLSYGVFIQGVIDFLITAFVIFLLVKGINKIRTMGKKKKFRKKHLQQRFVLSVRAKLLLMQLVALTVHQRLNKSNG